MTLQTIEESVFIALLLKKEQEYWQAIAYLWACSVMEEYEIIS